MGSLYGGVGEGRRGEGRRGERETGEKVKVTVLLTVHLVEYNTGKVQIHVQLYSSYNCYDHLFYILSGHVIIV